MSVRAVGERIAVAIGSTDTVDVATRLSLLLILLSDWIAGEDWYYKAPPSAPTWRNARALFVLTCPLMLAYKYVPILPAPHALLM